MSSQKKKVLIALSGGVDSAVAAYLLKENGYDVTAVNMIIYKGAPLTAAVKGCYGCEKKEEQKIAKAIAETIGIPFHVFDCAEEYHRKVIAYFKKEYLSGRTPNPCIRCNMFMKFGLLPELARKNGIAFDAFATGHYASVIKHDNGRFYLKKAADEAKDQTYFLYGLTQEQLAQVLFPLGGLKKDKVREIAATVFPSLKLETKAESQDFYGGDYNDIIGVEPRKGQIVNEEGEVLGFHNGFWNFTLGQRKGLGVAAPRPLYVIAIEAENNRIVVAEQDKTQKSQCFVHDFTFFPVGQDEIKAKIRSTQCLQSVKNIGNILNGTVEIDFVNPVKAVSPGQSVVLYQNDLVIGGGILRR